MVYTDAPAPQSVDTNIMLRYSDNGGSSWSVPVRVNDDATANSQFFPKIAIDPTTGNVGIVWYDCRNDTGIVGHGSLDAVPNNDVQFYGAVGSPSPSGVDFSPNVQIQAGVSTASTAAASQANSTNDFGDYTGLAFLNGEMAPVWADNSNSTGDNPDGSGTAMDLYTSHVPVQTADAPAAGVPTAILSAKSVASASGLFSFTITYASTAAPIDRSTLGGSDVIISSNGFSGFAQVTRTKTSGGSTIATYRVRVPRRVGKTPTIVYAIALEPGRIATTAGQFAAGRSFFGTFLG